MQPKVKKKYFYMVDVAQLVRASDCGSEGRGFEPHLPPLVTGAPPQTPRLPALTCFESEKKTVIVTWSCFFSKHTASVGPLMRTF